MSGIKPFPVFKLVGTSIEPIVSGSTLGNSNISVSATDKVLGRESVGAGTVEEISCTGAGRALIDDADAAAQRTTLGLVAGGAGDIWVEKAGDTMTSTLTIDPSTDVPALKIIPQNDTATTKFMIEGRNAADGADVFTLDNAGNIVTVGSVDGVDISTHDHTGVAGHGVVLTAGSVTNVAAGNISSVTVQAAINELDTEKVDLTGDTMTGALSASTEAIRKTTRGRFGIQRIESNKPARTAMTAGAWLSRTSAADNEWYGIAWSPELGLFAAVAGTGSGNRVMTSPDGITWTLRTSAADNYWYSIAWSPELGLFAAVAGTGSGNRVMTSPDGITWTLRTSAADNNWYGIAWSPELGLFAAVASSGSGNRVMTSPDGITWTLRTSAADNNWFGIAWSPELGLFAAVAYSGTGNRVMTSPDGITWTLRTSAADNGWLDIAWSPELGLFAAVSETGTGNRVMTSPDGITWTSRTSAADNDWRAIAWSPELGLFAAVANTGSGDRVMTSPDGITWTLRTSAVDNGWRSIAWSPELGLFAAVALTGSGNRVMTSFPVSLGSTNHIYKGSQKIIGGTSTTADLTLQTTTGVGDTGADMHFLVGNNGATEAVTVLNSGNVGISQVSPSAKLDIVATDAENATALEVNQLDTSTAVAATVINAGTGDGLFLDQNGSGVALHIDNDGTANSITVEGTTATDFTVSKAGNVGIGIATPRAGLDIGTGKLVGTGLQLPHVVNKVASANVRNSHDAEATSVAAAYTKVKTITLTNGLVGQQRFLFDIKTSDAVTPETAYGRIYRNGVALGTEQTDVTGAYVTKSEDLTQTWNPTDTVELWVKIANADTVSVQNFRIAYDDSPTVAVTSANS